MSAANIELVKGLYAHYASGDFDSLLQGCSPNIEWCSGGSPTDFPAFGPRKGHAEVLDFCRTVADAVDFDEFQPMEYYTDKDKVFVLGTYTFRMKNGGGRVTSEWIHIFTFRGNEVVAFREFLDTARVVSVYLR